MQTKQKIQYRRRGKPATTIFCVECLLKDFLKEDGKYMVHIQRCNMWIGYIVLNSPLELCRRRSWMRARHEHVKVRPFWVNCTEGKEVCWDTKLCDHIIQFTSFFVPKGVCPKKRSSKTHGMVNHMRIWNLVELGEKC